MNNTAVDGSTVYNSPTLDVEYENPVNYFNKVDTAKLSTLKITKNNVGAPLFDRDFYYMKVQLGSNAESLTPIPVGTTYNVSDGSRTVTTAGIIKIGALIRNKHFRLAVFCKDYRRRQQIL